MWLMITDSTISSSNLPFPQAREWGTLMQFQCWQVRDDLLQAGPLWAARTSSMARRQCTSGGWARCVARDFERRLSARAATAHRSAWMPPVERSSSLWAPRGVAARANRGLHGSCTRPSQHSNITSTEYNWD